MTPGEGFFATQKLIKKLVPQKTTFLGNFGDIRASPRRFFRDFRLFWVDLAVIFAIFQEIEKVAHPC